MKRFFSTVIAAATILGCNKSTPPPPPPPVTGEPAKPPAPPKPPPLTAEETKEALYALGATVVRRSTPIATITLSEGEVSEIVNGIKDAVDGKEPSIKPDEQLPLFDRLMRLRTEERKAVEKKKEEAVLAAAAKEKGAVKLPSGIVLVSEKVGDGAAPTATDRVRVNYRGTLTDGTEFDSSYKRGRPAEFPLGGVIKCWTEGIQKMKVNGKAKLVCPFELAYGERGMPAIPPFSTLTFEVELLAILPATPPPAVQPLQPGQPGQPGQPMQPKLTPPPGHPETH